MRTMSRVFIAGAAVCFGVVFLTHVAETFRILPMMGWGLPNSAGHYLDLVSAVLGCTLLALGLAAWAYRFLRWRWAKPRL
jgi:uncharacterized membrane protein HdeD (DUF308 family)